MLRYCLNFIFVYRVISLYGPAQAGETGYKCKKKILNNAGVALRKPALNFLMCRGIVSNLWVKNHR